MAVYADYLFYTEQYGGTAISLADFTRLSKLASAKLDELTFDRVNPIMTNDDESYITTNADLIERIRLATCAIAEELQMQSQGGLVASERVGNYAVTYAVSPAMSNQTRLSATARVYLGSSGLMFRGFDEDIEIVLESTPEEEPEDGGEIPV